MAQRIIIGERRQGRGGPCSKPDNARRYVHRMRNAPVALLKLAAPVLLSAFFIALVFGTYTLFSLPGRADHAFKHEVFPLTSARRGFVEPLDAENRARRRDGRPLLAAVYGRRHATPEDRANLHALQEKIRSSVRP